MRIFSMSSGVLMVIGIRALSPESPARGPVGELDPAGSRQVARTGPVRLHSAAAQPGLRPGCQGHAGPRRASPANTHLLPQPVPGCPSCSTRVRSRRQQGGPTPEPSPRPRAAQPPHLPAAGSLPWSYSNAPDHHAPDAGSRRPFRPPDPLLEPQDGPVHLRRPRQDPHHQPREDRAAVQRRDELHLRRRAEARHDPVRRHQALGARGDQGRGRALRHAVHDPALAGRHADQLPHRQAVGVAPEGTGSRPRPTAPSRSWSSTKCWACAASATSCRPRWAASRT